MAHVVIVTLGTGGDFYPFVRIGKAMIEEGYKVTLISHCVYEEEAKRMGFLFVSIDTYNEYKYLMNSEVHSRIQDPREHINFYRVFMLPRIGSIFKRIMAQLKESNTILIGNNTLHGLFQMLSEASGVPYLSVFLSPSFLDNGDMDENSYVYIAQELNNIRREVGLRSIVNWREMVVSYSHGIGFWSEWYTKRESFWPANLTLAGFLLHENREEIDDEIQRWLKQKPNVIITHGTSPPYSDAFYNSCIEACEYLGYPALVVTKNTEMLPKHLPPNIKHTTFLPFSKIMPQISVLIHHGGIGTTGQALRSGTPQLILGKGFDRPRNGTCVKLLGSGEFLPVPKWNMRDVANALRKLVFDKEVKECCENVSRSFDAIDTDDIIKQEVRHLVTNPILPNWSKLYELDTKDMITVSDRTSLIKNLSIEQRQLLLSRMKNR